MGRQQLISLGDTIKTAYEGESDTNAFTDEDRAYVTDLLDNVTIDVTAGDPELAVIRSGAAAGDAQLSFKTPDDATTIWHGGLWCDFSSRLMELWGGWCSIDFNDSNILFKNGNVEGVEWMRINDVGNIGIGTTNPQETLHVDGTVRLDNLPTSDPESAGALWNDSGTLKISAG